jgi:hypothetical protein
MKQDLQEAQAEEEEADTGLVIKQVERQLQGKDLLVDLESEEDILDNQAEAEEQAQ